MNKANCLLFGFGITEDTIYRDVALAQLNYIMGLNSLDMSFVMSHGTHAMQHPFNWIYIDYGLAIPGWCAGGANQYTIEGYDYFPSDLIKIGTPPAKCYVETAVCFEGSWASNEVETSENAALTFLSGYFYKTNAGGIVNERPTESSGRFAVYPTPCDLKGGCSSINFSGLPKNSVLEIRDVAGKMIYRTEINPVEGRFFWDLKDRNNVTVQPGVYVYLVSTSIRKVQGGKIIIIK
jgi:hypothetical protein